MAVIRDAVVAITAALLLAGPGELIVWLSSIPSPLK